MTAGRPWALARAGSGELGRVAGRSRADVTYDLSGADRPRGRTLLREFADIADVKVFIAENGSPVMRRGTQGQLRLPDAGRTRWTWCIPCERPPSRVAAYRAVVARPDQVVLGPGRIPTES